MLALVKILESSKIPVEGRPRFELLFKQIKILSTWMVAIQWSAVLEDGKRYHLVLVVIMNIL